MKLVSIFNPELDVVIKYRVMAPAEIDRFLATNASVNKEEFARTLLEQTIFNLNSDVASSLRKLPKNKAKTILSSLVNSCLMLNPSIDVDGWHKIATASSLFDFEETKTTNNSVRRTKSSRPAVPSRTRSLSKIRFMGLEESLRSAVFGQDEAITQIVNALKRSVTGLRDDNRPLGVFLLAGSSGVGKTMLAKQVHNYLFGAAEMARVDCGEYQQKHENQKLIGCFVPETSILLASGNAKKIEDIQIGDSVITHTGTAKQVVETYRYDHAGEMVELSVANSNVPLIATSGHEILAIKTSKQHAKFISRRDFYPVCKPENLTFVPAGDLEKDDIVAYPRWKHNASEPQLIDLWDYVSDRQFKCNDEFVWYDTNKKINRYISIDESFMRLAGYYVSQGGNSNLHKAFNFTISHEKRFQMDEIHLLLKEVFGFEGRVRIQHRKSTDRLYLSSRPIALMLSDLFGQNVYTKRVPSFFLSLDEKLLSSFVETAILGDGSTTTTRRVQYDTVSPSLFYPMEAILRKIGFATQVQLRKPSKNGWKDCYRIYIGGTQIVRFAQKFAGLSIDLNDLGETGIQRLAYVDDNYIYLRIKGTKAISYEGYVYDFKVEDDASYTANGVIVHNSPPGYVGYDDGGRLINVLQDNPATVVLFDEVEKAHPDIMHTLLRAFDEGAITSGQGVEVSLKNTIVFLTTNLGNREITSSLEGRSVGFGTPDQDTLLSRSRVERVTKEAVKKKFSPEFLNRLDKIIVFNHLSKTDSLAIAENEIHTIAEKLGRRGYSVTFDDRLIEAMVRDGFSPVQGARGLAQLRRERIEDQLADLILTGSYPQGTNFRLTYDADRYQVRARRPAVPKRKPAKACSSTKGRAPSRNS